MPVARDFRQAMPGISRRPESRSRSIRIVGRWRVRSSRFNQTQARQQHADEEDGKQIEFQEGGKCYR